MAGQHDHWPVCVGTPSVNCVCSGLSGAPFPATSDGVQFHIGTLDCIALTE